MMGQSLFTDFNANGVNMKAAVDQRKNAKLKG
jgi:hypothetical protein